MARILPNCYPTKRCFRHRVVTDLVVRSADGVLRKARNLGVGCLIEAVRSAKRTIDIDTVNRVLMQPHWQKETDLVDY